MRATTSDNISISEFDNILPNAEGFFKGRNLFIQMLSYWGNYKFDNDIFIDITNKYKKAIRYTPYDDSPVYHRFKLKGVLNKHKNKRCFLSYDRGPCKALFWRYYYDQRENRCKPFIWGGCKGSVPFKAKEECSKACITKLN